MINTNCLNTKKLILPNIAVRLGRLTKHFRPKSFNVTNAIPGLDAKSEKDRTARFGSPTL